MVLISIEQGPPTGFVPPTKKGTRKMNKQTMDNKANQQNPNHSASGQGRAAGYRGAGTRADLNNHANQLNPNNKGK